MAAEPADFVHIFNVASNQDPSDKDSYKHQIIDFFGEIAGISLVNDYLYIGCADETYGNWNELRLGSILEFERKRTPFENAFI